ncbi:Gfo/Idh/MocA family oxidoreductase [Streptosporangium sp. NPDC051023]|uniref:Gfo/Idh/MocA family protein n=1 Tax=Streptosporangium sp. NPDC051023 TaxID=3155410 RepID=UPI00344B6908
MSTAFARPIRVGVVGASPGRGWGTAAHLPALLGLEEYTVTAVATTKPDSARRTAAAFGIEHAFADVGELAAHPDVDVVAAVVRAPGHAEAVRTALAHGKHVVSEWPLGVNLAEAVELAEAATAAGVVHAVVLQGFHSHPAAFVKELIAEGRIGELESITVVAAGDPLGGDRIFPDLAWSVDPAAGSNLLTIMAGHFLAMAEHLAGPLTEVSASLAYRHREVVVAETGERVPSGVPSHVAAHGLLESGATAALSVHGGGGTPSGFQIKITGNEGALTVTPVRSSEYMHWGDWTIVHSAPDGTRAELPLPSHHAPPGGFRGPATHIAAFYRRVAPAFAEGRQAFPSFHDAVRQHRVLAAVEHASRTGARQKIVP